jgi:hypothetical protein
MLVRGCRPGGRGRIGAARAGSEYGYAERTISGLKVTTAVSDATVTGTSTSAAAVINGVGVATNAPTDTLQAYQGALPMAPQNDYSAYSTVLGGPQAGDFTRGDAIITGSSALFTSGVSASNVAESILSSGGIGSVLLTGNGNWTISSSFMTTASSVTISYNYANAVYTDLVGLGNAQASFKAAFTIKDQHGHEVDAAPTELNTQLASLTNGPEIIKSGTGSVTLSLAGLTAGDTLALSITGTELTSVTTAAVPEPGSIVSFGIGAMAIGGLALARRRRAAR